MLRKYNIKVEENTKLFLLLFFLNLLIFSFVLFLNFKITEYLFIVYMSVFLEISFIGIFKNLPFRYSEELSGKEKRRINIILLVLVALGWYGTVIVIGIKYYPNLKKLPLAEHFMHPHGSLWKYISPPIKEKSNDNNNR